MKWTNKGHQFDELGYFLAKPLLIYGAGIRGIQFLEYMMGLKLDGNIEGFIDRNAADIKECRGLPVYGTNVILPEKSDKYILVVAFQTCKNVEMVCDRLTRAGYIKGRNYFLPENFRFNLNDIFFPVYAMYAVDKLILSSGCIIPSTVCNLNCRDCLNFTPYIRKFETRTLDSLEKDIDKFFDTIDYVARYQISGGEPLLYPQLKELITYIGSHYRNKIGVFETVLNGTIVPKDDICEVAKRYSMTMILDNYTREIPSKLNHRAEILAQFAKYELLWIDNTVDDWFDLDIFGTDHSKMTDDELQEFFDSCNNPWHCYENGKFYACNFARFSEKAGMHSEPESSCFDITELNPERKMELLEFLLNYNEKGYVELCKRCSGWADYNPKRVPVAVQKPREK